MKYETFYDLFLSNGFRYITTEGSSDIYERDGQTYRFCFVCGFISRGKYGEFGLAKRFPRSIQECKEILITYFNEEKKNQTAAA